MKQSSSVTSELQGGKFCHGFYSSAVSTGVMHIKGVEDYMMENTGGWDIAGRTMVAAAIGGTTAELSGGKFADGAVTSAFQHLCNQETSKRKLKDGTTIKRAIIFGPEIEPSEGGENNVVRSFWVEDLKKLNAEFAERNIKFEQKIKNAASYDDLLQMATEYHKANYDEIFIIFHGGSDEHGKGYIKFGSIFNYKHDTTVRADLTKIGWATARSPIFHCTALFGVNRAYHFQYANHYRLQIGAPKIWVEDKHDKNGVRTEDR